MSCFLKWFLILFPSIIVVCGAISVGMIFLLEWLEERSEAFRKWFLIIFFVVVFVGVAVIGATSICGTLE